MLQKINPYRDGITLTDCVDVLDPIQSKIFCFVSDGGDSGGSSVDDPYGVGDSGEFSSGGGNNNFSSGGGSSGGDDDSSSSGTIFGVGGVSKTGSTADDAAIGWTSSAGSGQPGNNYGALQNATTSEVDYARTMADKGASVSQIATFLNTGTDPFATAEGGTQNQGSSVGSIIQGVTQQVIGQAGYTAPTSAKRSFDNVSGTLTGGVSGATGARAEGFENEAFESGVTGDVEFGEIPSQTLDRSQFQPSSQDDRARRGDIDTSQDFSRFYGADGSEQAFKSENLGLTASEAGNFALVTQDQLKDLGEKYGVPNIGNMTKGAQQLALAELIAANPDIKFGRADQLLGGQGVVRNQQVVDYNPETGSYMVEGGGRGFLGSDVGRFFGAFSPSTLISTGLGLAGTANSLRNAQLDKDTASIFGTVGEVLGVPISGVTTALDFAGVDINQFLPQLSDSKARGRSMFTDMGDDGDTPISQPLQTIPDQPSIRPDIPDTAPTGLLKRKRMPGQDVYGVTTNDFPFMAISDELNVSGLGMGQGRGRAGKIQQNRGR